MVNIETANDQPGQNSEHDEQQEGHKAQDQVSLHPVKYLPHNKGMKISALGKKENSGEDPHQQANDDGCPEKEQGTPQPATPSNPPRDGPGGVFWGGRGRRLLLWHDTFSNLSSMLCVV